MLLILAWTIIVLFVVILLWVIFSTVDEPLLFLSIVLGAFAMATSLTWALDYIWGG